MEQDLGKRQVCLSQNAENHKKKEAVFTLVHVRLQYLHSLITVF